jgi:hypothetical protein
MTETKTGERDMSVFTKQTMKNRLVKDKHGRPKLFARYIETATATGDEVCVCGWYYAYPFSEEREPERREQRMLETRSWHDADKVTCRKP